MNKNFISWMITDIKKLSDDSYDIVKDLEELFKNKSLLNTHFSGKDKDLLRVIKSSLVAILKKEKDIEKLEFCTNVPLKEKCINLLKKYGYKLLYKDPYENALVYDKEKNGIVITIYLETFEKNCEFEGRLGLEILTEHDISVYYNLKTEDLSDILSKIESVIKNKKWTCYDIFKKLSARNNHIEEADDNYFNYDEKTKRYSLKKQETTQYKSLLKKLANRAVGDEFDVSIGGKTYPIAISYSTYKHENYIKMQEILDKNNIEYEAFDDNTENNGKKTYYSVLIPEEE